VSDRVNETEPVKGPLKPSEYLSVPDRAEACQPIRENGTIVPKCSVEVADVQGSVFTHFWFLSHFVHSGFNPLSYLHPDRVAVSSFGFQRAGRRRLARIFGRRLPGQSADALYLIFFTVYSQSGARRFSRLDWTLRRVEGMCGLVHRLKDGQEDAFGILRHALGKPDLPLAMAFVYLEDDGCFSWWIVVRGVDKEEVGPHLLNRNRGAIDNETHLDQGGMCAVTLFRNHERRSACTRSPLCVATWTRNR